MIRSFGSSNMGQIQGIDLETSTGGVIKRIQRGKINLNTIYDSVVDVTLPYEVVAKNCIVNLYFTPHFSTASKICFTGKITSPTNLQLQRYNAASTSVYVSWEVIEYLNVKSSQEGITSVYSSEALVTVNKVDLSKSILSITYRTNLDAYPYANSYFSNDHTISVSGALAWGMSGGTYDIQWKILEFN